MTIICKDFVVLIRSDNMTGAGAQWFPLDRFTTAAAAWDCLHHHRALGKTVKIVRH
jgi:hypothetical protein